MEILMAILFGGAVVIGGFAGFISLFTKGDKEARLKELEKELAKLGNRLARLENPPPDSQIQQAAASIKAKEEEITISVLDDQTDYSPATPVIAKEVDQEGEMESAPIAQTTFEKEENINEAGDAQPSPIKPIEPNIIDKAFNYAKDWLFGGNTLVRSGIVLLFIGISFLIKYVAENSNVPIEFRMTGIALFGIALLVIGWRLRNKRTEYAWALQGGGIGVLYLTIFAAMKLYQLIPPGAAFTILIIIAFLSAAIAVLQSALPLAILGFTGGFLAPIFTSTGGGSHVGLFSYYLVLNLAIAFIAYHKSWRPLNVLGFAFTFIIGTIWGAKVINQLFLLQQSPFSLFTFYCLPLSLSFMRANKQQKPVTMSMPHLFLAPL